MSLYSFRGLCIVALTTLALVTGCQPAQPKDPYAPVIQSPQPFSREILGYSVQNRPIELITAGTGSEIILIIATIHGNEPAGTPIMYELLKGLRRRSQLLTGRTLLIVPVANPDGMVLNTRFNVNGIDLNRNFPASNRINNHKHGISGLTEPESKILHDLITTRRPVRILAMHQPLICIDYDGPGEAIARRMQMYCSLPLKKLGARPGSLGSFAGVELNIPIITMELKQSDTLLTPEQLWAAYGPAVLAFLTYPDWPY